MNSEMTAAGSLPKLAVLVNTCDKFEDCWEPFFVLWRKFGIRILPHTIYLNTERKTFKFGDIPIRSLRVCSENGWTGSRPPTWSWCLARALDAIPEPLVLYLQEDYFLTQAINETWLSETLKRLEDDSRIGCIHLTRIAIRRTLPAPELPGLLRGNPRDWYFVSCQAAVWRKVTLRALLRMHEDAWQFERWASKRARQLGCRFYVPARAATPMPPIDYVKTGIVQGKWLPAVVPLFREHGIDVDFSRRGFYVGKYGKKENGWFRWQWNRARYNIMAFAARFIWPPKSLFEILSPRRRKREKNSIFHENI